ncbi:MAG: helix-turn-helix domain-containing protein [Clostridiales bacterium]|nr:helix-turn-helix domain-containing protein [Clostridiales bacterium]
MKIKTIREYPDLLSVLDVMDILRIGRVTVYQFIQERKLAARKIAGKYRIPKSSVMKFIREIEGDSCYNNGSEGSDALIERSVINEQHTAV